MLIIRTEKDRHDERECEARTLNCKYCKVTFSFKDIKVRDTLYVVTQLLVVSAFMNKKYIFRFNSFGVF